MSLANNSAYGMSRSDEPEYEEIDGGLGLIYAYAAATRDDVEAATNIMDETELATFNTDDGTGTQSVKAAVNGPPGVESDDDNDVDNDGSASEQTHDEDKGSHAGISVDVHHGQQAAVSRTDNEKESDESDTSSVRDGGKTGGREYLKLLDNEDDAVAVAPTGSSTDFANALPAESNIGTASAEPALNTTSAMETMATDDALHADADLLVASPSKLSLPPSSGSPSETESYDDPDFDKDGYLQLHDELTSHSRPPPAPENSKANPPVVRVSVPPHTETNDYQKKQQQQQQQEQQQQEQQQQQKQRQQPEQQQHQQQQQEQQQQQIQEQQQQIQEQQQQQQQEQQ